MKQQVDLSVVDKRLAGMERPAQPGLTSGLSRALSGRLNIDVLLIRVGFVVLALFSGVGLALYLWGTALTPRAGGIAPIQRAFPRFSEWGQGTQLGVIGGSTLVVALIWSTGDAFFTMVLLGLAVAIWFAMRDRTPVSPTTQTAPPAPTAAQMAAWPPPQTPPSEAAETIEAWRERMERAAAMERLPEVNLYDPPPAAPPVARRSWLGALLVLAAGAGGATLAWVTGLTSAALITAVGAIASGAVLILWSLVRRSRRIPGIALALVMALSIGAATMGSATVMPAYSTPADVTADQREFDYINASGALDLTDHAGGRVVVNVVFSDVTILLPEGATVEVNQYGSTVQIPPANRSAESDLQVEINAMASTVTGTRS